MTHQKIRTSWFAARIGDDLICLVNAFQAQERKLSFTKFGPVLVYNKREKVTWRFMYFQQKCVRDSSACKKCTAHHPNPLGTVSLLNMVFVEAWMESDVFVDGYLAFVWLKGLFNGRLCRHVGIIWFEALIDHCVLDIECRLFGNEQLG